MRLEIDLEDSNDTPEDLHDEGVLGSHHLEHLVEGLLRLKLCPDLAGLHDEGLEVSAEVVLVPVVTPAGYLQKIDETKDLQIRRQQNATRPGPVGRAGPPAPSGRPWSW